MTLSTKEWVRIGNVSFGKGVFARFDIPQGTVLGHVGGKVVVDPRGKFFDQLEATVMNCSGMKADEIIRKFSAAKDDRDAACCQRARQRGVAGEGLGTKEVVLMGTGIEARGGVRAGVEHGHDGLAL